MRTSADDRPAAQAGGRLQRLLPICGWLRNYSRDDFGGDLTAGIITAILLVPQGMAFAMLAGLPAQVGLYASILPPVLYALFGTSRTLAVGPVSVAAIMVAYALQGLPPGTDPIAAALVLALLSGVILLGMGALKLGVVANFLSHPVLSGFTTAAAIIIVFSQLPSLAGLQLPEGWRPSDLPRLLPHASLHPVTLLIGLGSAALLLATGHPLQRALIAIGLNPLRAGIVSRTGPLIVVLLATVVVTLGGFAGGDQVAVVGAIPGGFPVLGLQFPSLEFTLRLLPAAFFISLVGYVESVSIAKVLASRRRERIDPNQELIGLGAANAAAAIAGGMPVAGGFSRTMVNYGAGARTQLASIITAALVASVTVFFTPLLENVPRAALAAIIIIAVVKLIDVRGAMAVWRYDRVDGAVFALTVAGVLAIGIEAGLALGIAASLASFAWRAARPHVAVIGRIRGSEHFRNVRRHEVETWSHIVFIRVDENLTFANTAYLESAISAEVSGRPELEHVVLVMSSVNAIDSTAFETLERLFGALREAGVTVHLSDVKGPVMDRLEGTGFLKAMEPGRVFLSAHLAAEALNRKEY
ncbi:MAG TPA: sulfate permease [Burkholderiales bacterium]|nr:sulfate permease [Burkholderiales bacterium]